MPETGIVLQIILYYTYVIFARGICDYLHFIHTEKRHRAGVSFCFGDSSGTRNAARAGGQAAPKKHLFFTCQRLEGFDSI